MTALAASFNRQRRGTATLVAYPMDAVNIYKGALVGINASGYLTSATLTTSGFVIVGIAASTVDNSAGSAGDKWMVVESGAEFLLVASSITQAMVGNAMYVVDNATIDETATNSNYVGALTQYVSSTSGWVFIPEPGIASEIGRSIIGVGSGYAIARGRHTTVAAADTVVTGLTTVVSVVVSLETDPADAISWVSATIGDQAGTPAAGSVIIKGWQNTSGSDPTPAAAGSFSKVVNWIAVGTI